MNNKTKDLEKMALGLTGMFGIYWIYSLFFSKHLPVSDSLKTILGLFLLYGIGLGLLLFITRKISVQSFEKKKLPFKTISLCFLLQFTAITVFSMIMNILAAAGVHPVSINGNATSLSMLFLLLIFNPVIEEIVFRKIVADKLLKYGEGFYMLVSSFCFAIVHGVSLGVPQIIYTFILGMIWSYLMVKTGDLKLVIVMHGLSNLFGSILTQTLLNFSLTAAGIYSMLLMLSGITGLILFLVNKKKALVDGEPGIIKKAVLKDMCHNKGILIYTALTIIMMLLK